MANKRYKRYNAASLTQFRRKLIEEQGGSSQKILLESAMDCENRDFVLWLDGQIVHHGNVDNPIEGDADIPLPDFPPKFTGCDFINPSTDTINHWFSAWKVLHISDAANSSVWAYITRQMIAAEKLRPYDLMVGPADKGDEFLGKDKIIKALNISNTDKRKEEMDKCVRHFIRHLCGLYEVRSTKTLYQDCPFAKAWWQCHIAESFENYNDAIRVIRNKAIWGKLSEKISSSLTVLGDKNIRNGIIMFLMENDTYHKKSSFKDLLTSVGIMSTWCALGYFPPEQVKEHVAIIAEKMQPLGESTDTEDDSSEESE